MTEKKVLLVEDHPSVALVLETALISLDETFSIISVPSGEAAQKVITDAHWDLVIADYSLPGINGLELIRRIRAEFDRVIPWMLITAYGHPKVYQEAEALGVNVYLTKPFSMQEFRRVVSACLNIS
jgi:CheY-like chemotaxis protein